MNAGGYLSRLSRPLRPAVQRAPVPQQHELHGNQVDFLKMIWLLSAVLMKKRV